MRSGRLMPWLRHPVCVSSSSRLIAIRSRMQMGPVRQAPSFLGWPLDQFSTKLRSVVADAVHVSCWNAGDTFLYGFGIVDSLVV